MSSGIPRRRVWIVDDSPLDAQRARNALVSSYDIEVFQDGASVLECLTSKPPPDVLVLDWVMPGISGPDVCRFLRTQPDHGSAIGIVLLTAHRAVEQIVEGLSAGANDYLAKPYEPEELQARVMSQVRARELLERATRAERVTHGLLESAPDAMLAIDLEGRVVFANSEAGRVFECVTKALVGQPIHALIPAWSDLAEQLANDPARPLPDVTIGTRVFSPTNRATLISDQAAATVSLRDVTARRAAEARRLDFYSIVAHDLRSPLGAISLRTELILRGERGALTPEAAADVRKIDRDIKSLTVLINDFLEMASVENAPITIERSNIDISSLLDATMEGVRPLLEANRLAWRRIATACSPSDCRVSGDVNRLNQVFGNLIGNAIKFTESPGLITTEVRRVNGSVEVSVADTGRGIPRQALPTLFDRYTRAERGVPGSGLGLMIVREIVQAHGGSVGVESEVGAGSRFWVRLPALQNASR
ncbi:MAG TPA: ATP-binding protein [Polyangiaceae bacterium]